MAKITHLAIVLVIGLACPNIGSCFRSSPLFGASDSPLFGASDASGLRGTCSPSGYLPGKTHHCNTENDSDCCKTGQEYPQYKCSPPATGNTHAQMTINSFAKNGDGGGPSECDNSYHNDTEMVVALSTGWYNHGHRCLKNIRINANGRSVLAKVVDECDSINGCDADHDYQPPCPNNIVDASPAVWKALGIPKSEVGGFNITWSDV